MTPWPGIGSQCGSSCGSSCGILQTKPVQRLAPTSLMPLKGSGSMSEVVAIKENDDCCQGLQRMATKSCPDNNPCSICDRQEPRLLLLKHAAAQIVGAGNEADLQLLASPKSRDSPPDSPTGKQKQAVGRQRSSLARRSMSGSGLHGHFLQLGLKPLTMDYERDDFDKSLADGKSSLKCYIHKLTQRPRAVLSMRKAHIPMTSAKEILQHVEKLRRLDHPNVVRLRDSCEDELHLHLVYDWCEGGMLMNALQQYESVLCEEHVAEMMNAVLSGLAAAHSNGLHHLDMSLHCLFVGRPNKISPVRLLGIGLGGFLGPVVSDQSESRSNKHYYAAPELCVQKVSVMIPPVKHACDIWSCGAMLFTLLCGRPPFGYGSIKDVAARAQKAQWSFGAEFRDYTRFVKSFLERILVVPWKDRPNATELMNDPWLVQAKDAQKKGGQICKRTLLQLKDFVEDTHIRKTLSRFLADVGLSPEAFHEFEQRFHQLDLNGDGTIAVDEVMTIASSIPGVDPQQMKKVMNDIDTDGNATVEISEFVAALVLTQEEFDEDFLRKAFQRIDLNRDARISKAELFSVLRQYSESLEPKEASSFISSIDADGDEMLNFQEFSGIFARIRDDKAPYNHRRTSNHIAIQGCEELVEMFRNAVTEWLAELKVIKERMQLANLIEPPEGQEVGNKWSYALGHFSEQAVHRMFRDALLILQKGPRVKRRRGSSGDASPGSPKSVWRTGRRGSDPKASSPSSIQSRRGSGAGIESPNQGSPRSCSSRSGSPRSGSPAHSRSASPRPNGLNERRGSGASILGISLLRRPSVDSQQSIASQFGPPTDAISPKSSPKSSTLQVSPLCAGSVDSAYSGEGSNAADPAHVWAALKARWNALSIDSSNQEQVTILDILSGMLQAKSQLHWQTKVSGIIDQCRQSCIEERVDVEVRTRKQLCYLRSQLNEEVRLLSDIRLGDDNTLVGVGSKLLQEKSCSGFQLRLRGERDKIASLHLPAKFVFYRQRLSKSDEAVRFMQAEHRRGLNQLVAHIDSILQCTDYLFAEVGTDLEARSALEGLMPSPPQSSGLYLRPRPHALPTEESATPRAEMSDQSIALARKESMKSQSLGSSALLHDPIPEGLTATDLEVELQRRHRRTERVGF